MSKATVYYYKRKGLKQHSEVQRGVYNKRLKAQIKGPRKNHTPLKKNPPNPQNLQPKKDQKFGEHWQP